MQGTGQLGVKKPLAEVVEATLLSHEAALLGRDEACCTLEAPQQRLHKSLEQAERNLEWLLEWMRSWNSWARPLEKWSRRACKRISLADSNSSPQHHGARRAGVQGDSHCQSLLATQRLLPVVPSCSECQLSPERKEQRLPAVFSDLLEDIGKVCLW